MNTPPMRRHASYLWKIWTVVPLILLSVSFFAEESPQTPPAAHSMSTEPFSHQTVSTNTSALTTLATTPSTPAPSGPLFTDQEWSQTKPVTPIGSATPIAPAVTSIVGSLLAVIALALGLAYIVKRIGVRRLMPNKGRHMELVEHLSIGPKRSVSMVRIGNQVLVLGQGEHELNHLATLPASFLEQPRAAPLAVPEHDPNHIDDPKSPSLFRKTLDKALGRAP